MNTTTANDTEIVEMMQTLMDEGAQGFPAVAARMYNLAMQFERELHLGAGRHECTEERTGYANGYKPKTLKTAAGNLQPHIPQVRGSDRPFYPKILFADATYHKVRVNGVVVSTATFIVTGVLEDGHRAILAVDGDLGENEVHWRKALSRLNERGMRGVKLIVSDDHAGLGTAREATLPGIPWQRCQMHLQRNAQAFVTKSSLKAEVAQDIRSVFNARSLDEAKRTLADIVEKYAKSHYLE